MRGRDSLLRPRHAVAGDVRMLPLVLRYHPFWPSLNLKRLLAKFVDSVRDGFPSRVRGLLGYRNTGPHLFSVVRRYV